jgi:hypothetical protein
MKGGAPVSAQPLIDRFRDVMKDKYRLADKFLVVASLLDAATASDDAIEFSELKRIRDGPLHALDMPSSPLPTDDVQKLLLNT